MDSDGRTGARLPPIALLSGARLQLDVEQASPEATSARRVVRRKLDQRQWRSHVETVPPPGPTAMSFGGFRGLSGCYPNPKEDVVTNTRTRVNKISTVVIPVSDQDRAIEFYVETLGFEKRVDVPFGNGYRWVEVAPGDAVTTIAIAPPPPGTSTGNRETGIGLQTDDIDAYHAELKADGVDAAPEVSCMGDPVPPLFWLRDPEGNTLMVVQ